MATLFGGLLAGIIFPLLLLISMVWQHGLSVALESEAPSVLLMAAMLGAVLGVSSGIILGFPAMLALRKADLDQPFAIVATGACISILASYFGLHLYPLTWSAVAFTALVGALCGIATCRLRRLP